LAQLLAHCSQAVGGGCSWDVGENGGGGEDGGEGNEHGGDTQPVNVCSERYNIYSSHMIRLS